MLLDGTIKMRNRALIYRGAKNERLNSTHGSERVNRGEKKTGKVWKKLFPLSLVFAVGKYNYRKRLFLALCDILTRNQCMPSTRSTDQLILLQKEDSARELVIERKKKKKKKKK